MLRPKEKPFNLVEKKQLQFSMAIENVDFMHECCPQHLSRGNARMKLDKTGKEGKQGLDNME